MVPQAPPGRSGGVEGMRLGAGVLAPVMPLMLCVFSQVLSLSVLVLIYTAREREDA